MMFTDFVLYKITVSSQHDLFYQLSKSFASQSGEIDQAGVLQTLLDREKLGSTGVGDGIAIPHIRVEGIDRPYVITATLDDSINYDAIDGKPVDIVCALVAPKEREAEHIQLLAAISRRLRDQDFCDKLRGATSKDAVYALMNSYDQARAA